MFEDNSSSLIYVDFPIDKKNEILNNLKKHERLPTGFYSQPYRIKVGNDIIIYRFQSSIKNGQPIFNLVFNKNENAHKPILKDNVIYFYDKELKRSLHIDKSILDEEIEKETELNLSSEQIETLSEGKEITIEITNPFKEPLPVYLRNKNRCISVDYNYFLGKISLLLKINDITKNKTLHLNSF